MTAALLPALALAIAAAAGPPAPPARGDAREAVDMLMQLASLPSESSDAAGVARTARWVGDRFAELGFTARELPGEGNPLLLVERPVDHPSRTILFYMHYDTQPSGPKEDWASTLGEPFAPRVLSGKWDDPATKPLPPEALDGPAGPGARIYARGIADDKGPIVMHLMAVRRWLASPSASRIH